MLLQRLGGAGLAATGIICPCHVLSGMVLAGLAVSSGSAPALSPALQDAVHAVYLPVAVLGAARLLTGAKQRA